MVHEKCGAKSVRHLRRLGVGVGGAAAARLDLRGLLGALLGHVLGVEDVGIVHRLVHVGVRHLAVLEVALSDAAAELAVRRHELLHGLGGLRDAVPVLLPAVVVVVLGRHVDELDTAPLAGDDHARRALDEDARVVLLPLDVAHAPDGRAVHRDGRDVTNDTTLVVVVGPVAALQTPHGRVHAHALDLVQTPLVLGVTLRREHDLLAVGRAHGVLVGNSHKRAVVVPTVVALLNDSATHGDGLNLGTTGESCSRTTGGQVLGGQG
mmetsp:Transcript_3677/g.11588  ORF Transcript_3677/g.11588 Transcript_3677/m.11588 type:complete len:265 (-) Transcript_3677:31-825(-)